jgi:hypothetical protein
MPSLNFKTLNFISKPVLTDANFIYVLSIMMIARRHEVFKNLIYCYFFVILRVLRG